MWLHLDFVARLFWVVSKMTETLTTTTENIRNRENIDDNSKKHLLDKDWGARIPEYVPKGCVTTLIFILGITMRGADINFKSHKMMENIWYRWLAPFLGLLLEISRNSIRRFKNCNSKAQYRFGRLDGRKIQRILADLLCWSNCCFVYLLLWHWWIPSCMLGHCLRDSYLFISCSTITMWAKRTLQKSGNVSQISG